MVHIYVGEVLDDSINRRSVNDGDYDGVNDWVTNCLAREITEAVQNLLNERILTVSACFARPCGTIKRRAPIKSSAYNTPL